MLEKAHAPKAGADAMFADRKRALRQSDDRTGRRYQRHELDVDVSLVSDHNFYAGFSENISEYGLFVATNTPRSIGETVEFSINLPNVALPIRGVGEVCWVRVYDEVSNLPPGLGLRFISLEAGTEQLIVEFLETRDPIYYESA